MRAPKPVAWCPENDSLVAAWNGSTLNPKWLTDLHHYFAQHVWWHSVLHVWWSVVIRVAGGQGKGRPVLVLCSTPIPHNERCFAHTQHLIPFVQTTSNPRHLMTQTVMVYRCTMTHISWFHGSTSWSHKSRQGRTLAQQVMNGIGEKRFKVAWNAYSLAVLRWL